MGTILPRRNKLRFARRHLNGLRSCTARRLHRQQRKRSNLLAKFAPLEPVGHLTSLFGSSRSLTQFSAYFASTTFTQIFLSLGPSNSQKNTPCHCPSFSFPSSTKIICDDPVKTALACESEFPSACR